MRHDSFWKRLWEAAAEVFLPLAAGGAKNVKMLTQAAVWVAGLGGTAWAVATWTDLLPPSLPGRMLFVVLLLLVAGLGVRAAYRLRVQLDQQSDIRRAERDEQRRQIVVAIHQLMEDFRALQKAVLAKSPDELSAAIQAMTSSLAAYREKTTSTNVLEAAQHIRIQAEIDLALTEESGNAMAQRLLVPIVQALGYSNLYGGRGTVLDQDELDLLSIWIEGCPKVAQASAASSR